jgi:dTDP-4-dehydrorhamnose reductase
MPAGVPELWGGIECTVNRVRDRFFDQLERNGHAHRGSDLELIAELGFHRLRYPMLWERLAPRGLAAADWGWAATRLHRLRELDLPVIAGLVHHGSGPIDTHLLDESFPTRLAEYAGAFAARFPWVDAYTPVNEPLTTARFSALYGIWYPHARDDHSFLRALLHECRGTVLAMRAIRAVNPAARLVQTDDLGRTFSTPALGYQADFENERRWLSWDLLCGRVDRRHPLHEFILGAGIPECALAWFRDNPCPPDVIGINHYLLSNRFLDERVERYPGRTPGGNGRDRYVDLEAVRVGGENWAQPTRLLREAWERYGLPVAITEVHLDSTRDEQMRWLREVWSAATRLREEGVEVRAVTVWGLLGLWDWNSLLTRPEGYYEAGAFDVRSGVPRPTALASMARAYARGEDYAHPALEGRSWWHDPRSWSFHRAEASPAPLSVTESRPAPLAGRRAPLLITGARGTLGRAFARICGWRDLACRALSREELDITRPDEVERVLAELRPWAVINAAGYARVDEAERDSARCFLDNVEGAARLAEACARQGLPFLTYSSDFVFGGASASSPYKESDPVSPLGVYGRSQVEAERRVRECHPSALVIRTSSLFGPWDEENFVARCLRQLNAGEVFLAPTDDTISPSYLPQLVNASLDLLIDGERGLWHLSNVGELSWADFACLVAESAQLDVSAVVPCRSADLGLLAPRPRYRVLGSDRGQLMPSVERGLARFFEERASRR